MSNAHAVARGTVASRTGPAAARLTGRTFLAALVVLSAAGLACADTIPTGCFKTGPALLLSEFFDFNNDGTPDQPVGATPKRDGDIILYESELDFVGGGQCAYSGGALCISKPAETPCPDSGPTACGMAGALASCHNVTPTGGITPLLCAGAGCPVNVCVDGPNAGNPCTTLADCPGGTPSDPTSCGSQPGPLTSKFFKYVANHADGVVDTAACPIGVKVTATATYASGTSELGAADSFPIQAQTPIPNCVLFCGDAV